MSDEKKVRIRIISRLTEIDGDVHEIKNARSGFVKSTAAGTVLEYDDVQDSEKAHIVLEMKRGQSERENRARMLRKGMVSSVLTFMPGQKIGSSYVTMYGEIPVAVDTRRVAMKESEKGGELLLEYDVYMGGGKTSGARMEITWRV